MRQCSQGRISAMKLNKTAMEHQEKKLREGLSGSKNSVKLCKNKTIKALMKRKKI